jgi:hypothetical protein
MQCTVPLGAADAFRLLTDFSVHERWIPLTRITAPPRRLARGDQVVAVTARFLVDRMEVVELLAPSGDVPGVLRMRKVGPVLLGDAAITVDPLGPAASIITWDEEVWLAGPLPPGVTRPLLAPLLDGMVRLALHRIQRDAAALAAVRDRRRASRSRDDASRETPSPGATSPLAERAFPRGRASHL